MIHRISIAIAVCMLATPCWARGGNVPPTAYGEFDFAMTTHKSELVSNNDTTNAIRYSVGAYVGSDKVISVGMTSETVSTLFELNSATSDFAFTDIAVNYHFWLLSIGVIIHSATGLATSDGSTTLFDMSSSGYGVHFGFLTTFGKRSEFKTNVDLITTAEVTDVNGSDMEIGPRMNIDIGASFDLTKNMLDLLIGYRMMTYTVTTDATYAEQVTSTYVGLGLDFMF